jgi:hypothetical protein
MHWRGTSQGVVAVGQAHDQAFHGNVPAGKRAALAAIEIGVVIALQALAPRFTRPQRRVAPTVEGLVVVQGDVAGHHQTRVPAGGKAHHGFNDAGAVPVSAAGWAWWGKKSRVAAAMSGNVSSAAVLPFIRKDPAATHKPGARGPRMTGTP